MMNVPAQRTPRSPALFAGAALIIIVTVLAYLPALRAGFIWDDDTLLVGNPLIRQADGLYRFWFTAETPDYFPATSTSLWLEWRLWGRHPLGYHLTNVLLHAASALLWWRVLARLLPRSGTAVWLAAAIFALHPVNVESVAWISQRKNTLAMFFYALSLLWYLRFESQRSAGNGQKLQAAIPPLATPNCGRRYYWLSIFAFVLSLAAKTGAVMMPLALLLCVWWQKYRPAENRAYGTEDVRRLILRLVPFFAIALVFGLITVWFQSHRAIGSELVRTDGFWSRLAIAGWAVGFYLCKALLPINLMFVYPRWQAEALTVLSFAPGFLLVALLLVGWVYRRQPWGRAAFFGLGYFVVMLLPVLGFVNIYFMRYSLVADHWQYFAIPGPIALLAVALVAALNAGGRAVPALKPLICGPLLFLLGLLTWRQCGLYHDLETLWQTTLERNPGCWLAHNNLGYNFFRAGRVDEAIAHYQKAIEINPDHLDSRINLGVALFKTGRMDEAVAQYLKAAELSPNDADVHNNLGDALLKSGRIKEGLAHLRKAVQINPQSLTARNNLAWALATGPEASLRNGAQAVALAEGTRQMAGSQHPELLATLAAAYAEAGRFSEAVATLREALRLTAEKGNQALTDKLRKQLTFYEGGLPYRAEDSHP